MGDHAEAPLPDGPRLRGRQVVLVIVAGALVIGLVWWLAPWHSASPVTMTGMAYPNSDATAIMFTPDSRLEAWRWGLSPDDGESFAIAGVHWTDATGTWYPGGTQPGCLVGLAEIEDGATTPVELHFVRVRGDGPGRVVTTLHCR